MHDKVLGSEVVTVDSQVLLTGLFEVRAAPALYPCVYKYMYVCTYAHTHLRLEIKMKIKILIPSSWPDTWQSQKRQSSYPESRSWWRGSWTPLQSLQPGPSSRCEEGLHKETGGESQPKHRASNKLKLLSTGSEVSTSCSLTFPDSFTADMFPFIY